MAVASKVDICNMALDHLGKPTITSLTDGSVEAQACARQYDIARRNSLSRSPWTFARRLRPMSLVVANPLEDTWAYRYDLPNNSLKLFQILSPGVPPLRNSPPAPHYLEEGSVYSHIPNAVAFYVFDSSDVLRWPTLFDETVALGLAMRLAPNMTRRKQDVDRLQGLFREMLAEAVEHDSQQETQTYAYYEGGYIDARDAGTDRTGRQTDGSTIWG